MGREIDFLAPFFMKRFSKRFHFC